MTIPRMNRNGTQHLQKAESKPKEMVEKESTEQVQSTSQVPIDDRLITEVSTDKAPQKHHSEDKISCV